MLNVGCFLFLFLLASCASSSVAGPRLYPLTLTNDKESISLKVERAENEQEWEMGLMNRKELAADKGMLFVFRKEAPLSFWMKNTLIPLDIMFFTRDGGFVSSASMLPCEADPCATYSSKGPAYYALELTAGFIKEHKIDNTWHLALEPVLH